MNCSKLNDLYKGAKIGKLTLISRTARMNETRKRYFWNCKCDCGKYAVIREDSLRKGHTRSCGCKKIAAHARYKYIMACRGGHKYDAA